MTAFSPSVIPRRALVNHSHPVDHWYSTMLHCIWPETSARLDRKTPNAFRPPVGLVRQIADMIYSAIDAMPDSPFRTYWQRVQRCLRSVETAHAKEEHQGPRRTSIGVAKSTVRLRSTRAVTER